MGDWVLVEGQGSLDHPAYSVGDARADPRRDAARDDPRPQARADRARLRPPARRVVPDRRAGPVHRLHERIAGLVAPSKVVAIALNTSLYPDDADARRIIAEIEAETGLPADDPVRFGAGPLWARGPRRAMPDAGGREPAPDPRGPAPGAARSVPHRPRPTTSGATRVTTVIVEIRDDRYPGIVGVGEGYPDRLLRRDAGDDGRGLPVAARRRRRARTRPRPAWSPPEHAMAAAIRGNGAAKCAMDIALHDLVGKVAGRAGPRAARPVGGHPADRLHDRHRRAGHRRAAGRPGGRLPGPQDQVRRSGRTSRRCAPSARSSPARSGWMPTPAGRARTPRRCCPNSIDLGVELIEQPFPARPIATSPGSRSDRRCRSSPTRAACPRGSRRVNGVVAGINVKLAKCGGIGPAYRMLERAASWASGRSSAAWRRRGGHRRFGGGREPRRLGGPGRQPAARRRPLRGPGAGPDKRWHRRSARSRLDATSR